MAAVLFSGLAKAQVYTTTQNGLFYNPLVWDCICVPADGDSLVINHDIQMNFPIYYTSGQIVINPGASLTEDGSNKDIWVNGGSLINNGTLEAYRLYISGGFITNTGTMGPLDSLWTQAPMTNSGTITTYDFLNDQTAVFGNSNTLTITNNFNNQGVFNNSGSITVANDFSNCNIQSMDAVFTNSGTMCITNDFSNCAGDTLAGSGDYFIGGSSANLGVFTGSFTFHTPSGTIGVPGTIGGGVTVTTGACNLSIENETGLEFSVYPNPTSSLINVSFEEFEYVIYDYTGAMAAYGWSDDSVINVDELDLGVYWLRVLTADGQSGVVRFIKE